MTDEHRETGTGWPDQESAGPAEAVTPEVAGPGSVALPTADASPPPTRRPKPTAAGREAAPAGREPASPGREAAPADRDAAAAGDEPAVPARPVPNPDGTPRPDEASAPADAGTGVGGRPSRRLGSATLVIAALLALLGFALVAQLRGDSVDSDLAAMREDDLVRLQSDLTAQEERLQNDITALEESQRQLQSGAQGRAAALQEAQRRADELEILAGTVPARGPGLVIRLVDGPDGIKASDVLNAVQELRGADAEAMQIAGNNGAVVRVVASTSFVDSEDGIVVSGQQLTGPYTITVIGDPPTMRTALNIPDGLVPSIRGDGGNVIVDEREVVDVTAIARPVQLEHAQPVS
jgi:uncharacterized protein YlxW (UPF0749 family)